VVEKIFYWKMYCERTAANSQKYTSLHLCLEVKKEFKKSLKAPLDVFVGTLSYDLCSASVSVLLWSVNKKCLLH